RIGLRYVSGLGEEVARRITEARTASPFASVADLAHRAALGREPLARLAECGALGGFGRARRSALWQVEAVGRSGPLFARTRADHDASPLDEMSEHDAIAADYRLVGLT